MSNLLKGLLWILLFLFLSANLAYAHRLNVVAEVHGLEIKISSYYSAGAKCKDCRVEIFSDNQKIKEGRTDEKGMFFFKTDSPKSIKIVISDRMGHRKEYEIDKREMMKK
jgi:hypothetical protein